MKLPDLDEMLSVAGKAVLLTGSGRGIGRGVARVFAQAGARVAVNARTEQAAGPLVKSLQDQGSQAFLVVGDLTKPDEATAAVERTIAHFGRIDILINALGDSINRSVVSRGDNPGMTDEEWRTIMDINLTHVFFCSRAAGRAMLEQGHGKIINISSFASVRGGANASAYATAKTGLVGLTRALALEWAPTIQVNAIAPGIFPDDEVISPAALRLRDLDARERIPMHRVGRPREVGYLALYLASPAADYMTGQTIHIDGGLTVT